MKNERVQMKDFYANDWTDLLLDETEAIAEAEAIEASALEAGYSWL